MAGAATFPAYHGPPNPPHAQTPRGGSPSAAAYLREQQRGSLTAQPVHINHVRRLQSTLLRRTQRRLHLRTVQSLQHHRRAAHDVPPGDECRGVVAVLAHADQPRGRLVAPEERRDLAHAHAHAHAHAYARAYARGLWGYSLAHKA